MTPDGERSFLIYGYPEARKLTLTAVHLNGARYLALDLYGGEERLQATAVAHQAGVRPVVSDVVTLDHPVLAHAPILTISAAYMREALPGVDVVARLRDLQALTGQPVVATNGPREMLCLDETGTLAAGACRRR